MAAVALRSVVPVYVHRAVRLSAAGSFRPVPAGRSRVGARRRPRYTVVARRWPFASPSEEQTWLTRSVGGGARVSRDAPSRSALGRDGESVRFQSVACPFAASVVNRSSAERSCVNSESNRIMLRPEIGRDYPLNLSILLSGGKETNKDSLSNGE